MSKNQSSFVDLCPKSCQHTVYTPQISYAAVSRQSIDYLLSGRSDMLSKALSKSLDINYRINSKQIISDIRTLKNVTTLLNSVVDFIESKIFLSSKSSVYKTVVETLEIVNNENKQDHNSLISFLRYNFDRNFYYTLTYTKDTYTRLQDLWEVLKDRSLRSNATQLGNVYKVEASTYWSRNRITGLSNLASSSETESDYLVKVAKLILRKCTKIHEITRYMNYFRNYANHRDNLYKHVEYRMNSIVKCFDKYYDDALRIQTYRKKAIQIPDMTALILESTRALENLEQKFNNIKPLQNLMQRFQYYLVNGEVSKSELVKRINKDDFRKIIDYIDSFTFDLKIQLNPLFLKWLVVWQQSAIESQQSLLDIALLLVTVDEEFDSDRTLQFIRSLQLWKRAMVVSDQSNGQYSLRSTDNGNDVVSRMKTIFKNNLKYQETIKEHIQVLHESYINVFYTVELELDKLAAQLSSSVQTALSMVETYTKQQRLDDSFIR